MSERERFIITGEPEEAAAQLWAHIQEKTMLDGEKLNKFDSPIEAAAYYTPSLSREMLENFPTPHAATRAHTPSCSHS